MNGSDRTTFGRPDRAPIAGTDAAGARDRCPKISRLRGGGGRGSGSVAYRFDAVAKRAPTRSPSGEWLTIFAANPLAAVAKATWQWRWPAQQNRRPSRLASGRPGGRWIARTD